jgi:hypothetical protein
MAPSSTTPSGSPANPQGSHRPGPPPRHPQSRNRPLSDLRHTRSRPMPRSGHWPISRRHGRPIAPLTPTIVACCAKTSAPSSLVAVATRADRRRVRSRRGSTGAADLRPPRRRRPHRSPMPPRGARTSSATGQPTLDAPRSARKMPPPVTPPAHVTRRARRGRSATASTGQDLPGDSRRRQQRGKEGRGPRRGWT